MPTFTSLWFSLSPSIRRSAAAGLALVVLIAAAALAACSRLPLDNHPCPCASGWQCCAGSNVCVSAGAQCPDTGPAVLPPRVSPSTLTTSTLHVTHFSAERAVRWSLDEGDAGGRVEADGTYVPPLAPGTYHLTATAADDPPLATTVAIVVTPLTLDLTAGTLGGEGDADGTGADVRFATPSDIASDGAGHVFIADLSNRLVRQLDIASNQVTTVAGQPGVTGPLDGTGSVARFAGPTSLTIEGGALFVGDMGLVRRVDLTTREVTTLAGRDQANDNIDGIGSAAAFGTVSALVGDGAGTLYAADWEMSTIRAISVATGEVTTLAGIKRGRQSVDGLGEAASFRELRDMAFEPPSPTAPAGKLYVSDEDLVRVIDAATGAVSTLELPPLGLAAGLAYQAGAYGRRLFVGGDPTVGSPLTAVDLEQVAVEQQLGLRGTFGEADGDYVHASFQAVSAIAPVGPGLFQVLDGGLLRAFSYQHGPLGLVSVTSTVAGRRAHVGIADGAASGALFHQPWSLAVADGPTGARALIADSGNGLVRALDLTTREVSTVMGGGTGDAGAPRSIALANPLVVLPVAGALLVADAKLPGDAGRIYRADLADGTVTPLAGHYPRKGCADGVGLDAMIARVGGMTTDDEGNVYLGDTCGLRRLALATGEVTTLLPGFTEGAPGTVQLVSPRAMIPDGAGGLYVSEGEHALYGVGGSNTLGGRLIRVDLATRTVTVVAGDGDPGHPARAGLIDGDRMTSRLASPEGLARDAAGRVYIADFGNAAVRRFDPGSGKLETLVGNGRHGVRTGSDGRLNGPSALAFTPDGDLIILDRAESSLLLLH